MISILLRGGVSRVYLDRFVAGVQPYERFTEAPIPVDSTERKLENVAQRG
jgi:hypothetical protein